MVHYSLITTITNTVIKYKGHENFSTLMLSCKRQLLT